MKYEIHPIAEIFPRMSFEEQQCLQGDIAVNGLLEPIWIYEGKILDGRHRYLACTSISVPFETREYEGDDPVGFVVSLNLRRRHLSESQRAMVAANIANMAHGGDRKSENQTANLRVDISQEQAATMLNVSDRSVSSAKRVLTAGAAELIDAVQSGKVSVNAAADVSTMPKREQTEIVARGEKEILAAAKDIRSGKVEARKQERIADIKRQVVEISKATPAAPDGLFNVISLDPPWPYGTEYDPNGRRAANPYPEMSLDDIAALNIPAADDCVLWLWTTHKFMRHSFALLDGWGFRDVAILTWAKDRMGLGTWLRSQSEFCIMAVKGSPVVTLTNQTTIISGPLREHSRKPDEFFQMVDSLCYGRKVDFFSREARDGWEQFGNETEKFSNVG
jgi:N6-adenosine-specific RNA methylase IME4